MQNKSRKVTHLLLAALVIAMLPATSAFALDDTVGPVTSAVAVVPNPATLNTAVTLTATVDDTTTGGSNIAGVQYSVNGGPFTDMTAADGAFDSPTEGVTASFTADVQGENTVCVQGTDAAGNTGAPECGTFVAQSLYTFKGFRPPVRPVNRVQAGRNVPLKWRLTMTADGKPVNDPTVFVAVMTYSVDCATLTGDPTTAVAESAPGKGQGKGHSLRYLGRGNWILNWKTPKSYAGSCRMLFVELSDGSTSPSVLFRFR